VKEPEFTQVARDFGMSKILCNGSKGPEIKELQTQLNNYLSEHLKTDGDFGPNTERAVRAFQKAVGFKGKDIDGIVGPKTTLALCQIFDLKICGKVTPKPSQANVAPPPQQAVKPPNQATKPTPVPPNATGAGNATQAGNSADLPKRFQGNLQVGPQYSARDGAGVQTSLSGTFRTRDYFPNSSDKKFYHGMHGELQFAPLVLGIPLPPSSIYTGQLSVTISPVTDWLVLSDRLHLFTPSVGVYGQIPLNQSSDPTKDDPSSHQRLGGFAQLEIFHYEFIKDKLQIGISGQESAYWDFKDRRVIWDPSALVFLQWTFGAWSKYTNP
jgi:peptidoglycan hydrolase-like protein with peptidoglycan-binding domain